MKTKGEVQPTRKWCEGIVNTENDHIKIRYGKDSKRVALVAPGEENSFIVQFLLKARPSDRKGRHIYIL